MKQPIPLLNHAVVQEQYDAFGDDTLSATEKDAYETHLRTCRVCQNWVARQDGLIMHLRADMPPPHQLSSAGAVQIQQAMYKQIKRSMLMQNVKLSLRIITAVAALMLIVGGVMWWQYGRDNLAASPTDPASPEGSTAANEAVAEAADQPTALTFAAPAAQHSQFEVIAALFNGLNPDMAVQVVSLSSESDPATQADTTVLSWPLASPDSYVALNDQLAADINPSDYFANALQSCQAGDTAYGLPFSLSPSYLYYDLTVWGEAGVTPPAAEWTWPELVQTITALSSGDGTRYGFGNVEGLLRLLAPLLAAHLDENGVLNVAELEPYLQDIASLVAAGHVANVAEDELNDLIVNGRVGLWLDNPVTLTPRVVEQGLGQLPVPAIGNEAATNPAEATCLVISRGAAQPEAAWRWLQFLAVNPPNLPRGSVPASRLVFEETKNSTLTVDSLTLERLWFSSQRSQVEALLMGPLQRHVVNGVPLADALAQDNVADGVIAEATAEATEPVIVPPPADAGPTRIRFYGDEFRLAEAVSAFNRAHPEITVNVSNRIQLGTFSMEAAAEEYDCFNWTVYDKLSDMSDLVWDLSDLAAPETLADYPPELLALFQEEDAVWGLPLEVDPLVIRYNENRFSTAGVPIPTMDWTVNDMINTAAQLGQTGESPTYGLISVGFSFLSGPDIVDLVLLEQGVPLWDVAAGTANVTDPTVTAVFNQYVGWLQQNTLYSSPLGVEFDERRALVSAGRAALWLTSSASRPVAIGVPGPYAVLPLPEINSQFLAPPYQSGLFISQHVADPSGCLQWLEFLTTRVDAIYSMPARQSVAASRAWANEVGPENAAVLREALARHLAASTSDDFLSSDGPKLPLYLWLQEAAEAVVAGSDPAVALANLQSQSETYLACVGRHAPVTYEAISTCASEVDPDFFDYFSQ